ncbi:MAG TPA: 4'-phosphopantetheinyl transferase superfamily protein [Streptosporangiaceae bacterium]|nr:4'-phosphopantetheinyl transferase superfamily protein [Streptosporangiaceae bacterium]
MDQRQQPVIEEERAIAAKCDVHVGRIQDLRPAHLALLDDSERARAQRYRLAADRDRFLLGSVLLRVAAARQLDVPPAEVAVDRTCGRCGAQHGRPVLPGAGLHASVSHSGEVVAVALTPRGPLGVDVEAVRLIDFAAIAESVCTPAERIHVRAEADFFTVWTRKEAVLKATGEGLSRPMSDVHVTPPGSAPALLGFGSGPPPACQLADLSVGDGYRACVAVLTGDPVTVSTVDATPLLAR